MQELTDHPCTLELKEKLQFLGLTMESYYVAAFKPVSDDPDLPALKKIIIEEKQSGRPKKLFIYSNSRLHYKKLPGCQKYLLSDLLHLLPCSGKKELEPVPVDYLEKISKSRDIFALGNTITDIMEYTKENSISSHAVPNYIIEKKPKSFCKIQTFLPMKSQSQ